MSKTLIIIIFIVSSIIIFGIIGERRRKARLITLANSRAFLSREDYVKHFTDKGYLKKHAEVLHDKLIEFIGLENYSVYPEDDLRKIYGFEDLDDVDFINQIISILNLRKLNDVDYNHAENKANLFNAEYILTLIKKASG